MRGGSETPDAFCQMRFAVLARQPYGIFEFACVFFFLCSRGSLELASFSLCSVAIWGSLRGSVSSLPNSVLIVIVVHCILIVIQFLEVCAST